MTPLAQLERRERRSSALWFLVAMAAIFFACMRSPLGTASYWLCGYVVVASMYHCGRHSMKVDLAQHVQECFTKASSDV